MSIFISLGIYSQKGADGIINGDSDRKAAMEKIKKGIVIDRSKVLKVEEISFIYGEPKRIIGVEIHDQTYKALHQIFESLDYKIEQIDLVAYAHLTKKDLPRGRWRHLGEKEINLLKMLK